MYTKLPISTMRQLYKTRAALSELINHYKCVCLASREFSTVEPKNLFEVYLKNSHWMGVYDRHPVTKESLPVKTLKERQLKEKEKQSPIDIPVFINPKAQTWTKESKRVGAVGKKLGTSVLWTKEGFRHQVTLVQIKDCHVMDTQISREDGGIDKLTQMLVGTEDITDEEYLATFSRQKMKWFDERGIFPKKFWTGFLVSKDALLLPGTPITTQHFQAGQYVNVQGITVKQGFQGVMKRWGMKGQPASHGQSKTHRKMGATGGGQDPGRIFPGKKMAGHVGGRYKTTPPLKIFRINTKFNVLYIRGPLPGEVGSYLKIKDGRNRDFPNEPPPFPTYFDDAVDVIEEEDVYDDRVCPVGCPSLTFSPYKL